MTDASKSEQLLAVYDDQLRGTSESADVPTSMDGPVIRVELGYKYLHVDASDDSCPILQRLGFLAVTTTTPYVHKPA